MGRFAGIGLTGCLFGWLALAPALALPPGFLVQSVIAEADFPSAMAFTPDGSRLFYTERLTGNIRVYDLAAGELRPAPFATVQVRTTGADERGLLGIALDPEFDTTHFVYVYHHPSFSSARITRFTEADNLGMDETVLIDGIPSASFHNGGYIGFGPDGKLYLTVGENGAASNAQDPGVIPGKVHRLNPDGTIPADNPFPGSPIWSYGLRNSFGFSFHPVTGSLFLSEPGPDASDEINRIVKGGNYGWPLALGCAGDPGFVEPLLAFTPVVTPNGNAVFHSNRYPARFLHSLFFGEYNTGRIRRSVLVGSPDTGALSPTTFLELGEGFQANGILDLKMGPDGNLWFSTPNSIRRIVFTLPLPLPTLASGGTPAIGNQIILSLLGNPGEAAFLVLTSPGTPFRRVVGLGVIPSSGVASTVIGIPNDPALVGRPLMTRGFTVTSTFQVSASGPLELVILDPTPPPGCVQVN